MTRTWVTTCYTHRKEPTLLHLAISTHSKLTVMIIQGVGANVKCMSTSLLECRKWCSQKALRSFPSLPPSLPLHPLHIHTHYNLPATCLETSILECQKWHSQSQPASQPAGITGGDLSPSGTANYLPISPFLCKFSSVFCSTAFP